MGTQSIMGREFLLAAAGIAVIGMLNFGVSFCLALAVALRARDVRWSDFYVLVKTVLSRIVRSPPANAYAPRSRASNRPLRP